MKFLDDLNKKYEIKYQTLKAKNEAQNSKYFAIYCICVSFISLVILSLLIYLASFVIDSSFNYFNDGNLVFYYVFLILGAIIYLFCFLIYIYVFRYTLSTLVFQFRCNKNFLSWLSLISIIIYVVWPIIELLIIYVF